MSDNKPYKSKDGFEQVPVRRGYTEIDQLVKLLNYLNVEYYICGGYVRFMCSPQAQPAPAGDVDIYCKDQESFDIIKKDLSKKLNVRHENNMSLTFQKAQRRDTFLYFTPTIQLIKPFRRGRIVSDGSMEDILSNFDFTIVRAGLINSTYALVDADFEHDEARMILRLKNIHCPISSTLRCMKYSKKGYWLPPTQCVKLFVDWDLRDWDYKNEIVQKLEQANEGRGLTQEEIDKLEELMRVD